MAAAVIFDLDGTLVDTLDEITFCLGEALSSVGVGAAARERVRSWVGEGVERLVEQALPGEDGTTRSLVVARVEACFERSAGSRSRPYPGIPALLDVLSSAGVTLAVLSNKPDAAARRMVEHFFPGRFAAVRGVRHDGRRKPAPELVWELLEQVGARRSEAVLVGDSAIDLETASGAGVASAAVSWGFRDRRELEQAGAGCVLDRPAELLRVLEGIGGESNIEAARA